MNVHHEYAADPLRCIVNDAFITPPKKNAPPPLQNGGNPGVGGLLCFGKFSFHGEGPRNYPILHVSPGKKLDDGWPESEKGDVTAAVNMMITR